MNPDLQQHTAAAIVLRVAHQIRPRLHAVRQHKVAPRSGISQSRFEREHRAIEPERLSRHERDTGRLGRAHNLARLSTRAGQGFFDQYRLAGLDRGQTNRLRERGRCHDRHRLHRRVGDQLGVVLEIPDPVLGGDRLALDRIAAAHRDQPSTRHPFVQVPGIPQSVPPQTDQADAERRHLPQHTSPRGELTTFSGGRYSTPRADGVPWAPCLTRGARPAAGGRPSSTGTDHGSG